MSRRAVAFRAGWTQKMPHTTTDCPNEDLHTPQPAGYLQWHDWAEKRMRTHTQIRCDGCGLYAIWVERARHAAAEVEGVERT